MSELFGQLGINFSMLMAQAVNFSVLLVVLTIFVYKPLIKILEERRKKIEFGIKGSFLAEEKLKEAELAKDEKLKEADKTAVKIIGGAENIANKRGQEILATAHDKSESIMREAKLVAERKKAEELEKLSSLAGDIVREAIAKAVMINPAEVDRKLVEQASDLIQKEI